MSADLVAFQNSFSDSRRRKAAYKSDQSLLTVVILSAGVIDRELLEACFSSVETACSAFRENSDVILVDNASSSGLSDFVREKFPAFQIIRFDHKVGFCEANNAAFRESTGRFILQLNDDTELDPLALKEMLTFLDQTKDAGAVGPMLLNPNGTFQVGYCVRTLPQLIDTFCHLFWINRLFPNNPFLRKHFMVGMNTTKVQVVEQVAGASIMYRREALFSLELLDERFTFAFDDVDICLRLKRRGYNIYYLPTARVKHYGGITLNKAAAQLNEYWFHGMLHYYEKNATNLENFIFRAMLICAIMFRLPVIALLSLRKPRSQYRKSLPVYLKYLRITVAKIFATNTQSMASRT